MPIKVLNSKTQRYNSIKTLSKPALRKVVKTLTGGKSLPTKFTKNDLGKIITSKCSSKLSKSDKKPLTKKKVSSKKPSDSASSNSESSKKKRAKPRCRVKKHSKTVGKGENSHGITVDSYLRKC